MNHYNRNYTETTRVKKSDYDLNLEAVTHFVGERKYGTRYCIADDVGINLTALRKDIVEEIKKIVRDFFGRLLSGAEKVFRMRLQRINGTVEDLWIPNKEKNIFNRSIAI